MSVFDIGNVRGLSKVMLQREEKDKPQYRYILIFSH